MYGTERRNVLRKIAPGLSSPSKDEEGIQSKLAKAYNMIRARAEAREKWRRKGNAKWEPQENERVLVRTQPMSDAIKGITAKFMDIFEGPFIISKVLDHSSYELKDEKGKIRGEFNKKQLKKYKYELQVN
jgi:hypothetical protein